MSIIYFNLKVEKSEFIIGGKNYKNILIVLIKLLKYNVIEMLIRVIMSS